MGDNGGEMKKYFYTILQHGVAPNINNLRLVLWSLDPKRHPWCGISKRRETKVLQRNIPYAKRMVYNAVKLLTYAWELVTMATAQIKGAINVSSACL